MNRRHARKDLGLAPRETKLQPQHHSAEQSICTVWPQARRNHVCPFWKRYGPGRILNHQVNWGPMFQPNQPKHANGRNCFCLFTGQMEIGELNNWKNTFKKRTGSCRLFPVRRWRGVSREGHAMSGVLIVVNHSCRKARHSQRGLPFDSFFSGYPHFHGC